MVGTWSRYGRIDLVTTYLAQTQHWCDVSLVGTQGGRLGHLSLRNLRALNGPWRLKCADMAESARPTVTKQKCYNVIDVARVLGPAMILRDPATPCRKVHCPEARLSELNDSRA